MFRNKNRKLYTFNKSTPRETIKHTKPQACYWRALNVWRERKQTYMFSVKEIKEYSKKAH